MPQDYYTYSNTLIDGQTAKASEVKAEFQAVETGLDAFYDYTVAQLAAVNSSLDSLNNYKGEWSSLTGALAQPASVSHSSRIWILNTDLADVTTKEPGVDSEWDAAIPVEGSETFTTTGTFTKNSTARVFRVDLWGAGAGGSNSASTTPYRTGGGGGAYVSKTFLASELSASETVTIGAGGSGGADGGDNAGSDGGDTSFGSLLTASGGKTGGTAGDGGVTDNAGGVPHGGYSAGSGGATNGGAGGGSVFGGAGGGGAGASAGTGGTSTNGGDGGAGNITASTPGSNGTFPSGGGGGSTNDGGGGDGANGKCIVYWW